MEKVDKIVGLLVEGRKYLVPTIRGEWLKTHGIGDWPVIGPRHKDDDLGVNVSHYHIDHRFVDMRDFQRDNNTLVNESVDAPLRYEVWVCRQNTVIFRTGIQNPAGVDINAKYAGIKCGGSKETGWTCPHRGAYLGSQPIWKGTITCPLHGIVIDAGSGRVCHPSSPSSPTLSTTSPNTATKATNGLATGSSKSAPLPNRKWFRKKR